MNDEIKSIKKLYRSRVDRYAGGVCGGLASYFNIDSMLIRVLFVISALMGGLSILVYLAALFIVPEDERDIAARDLEARKPPESSFIWGAGLIGLGVLLLLRETGMLHYFNFDDISWSSIWAVLLIAGGVALLFSRNDENSAGDSLTSITRPHHDRKLAGVCSGIASYYEIDVSLVRLIWILTTLISGGIGLLLYIGLIFVFPEENATSLSVDN
ncbi:MAG: PspC domain-containing protein [Calditrichia bacterium]